MSVADCGYLPLFRELRGVINHQWMSGVSAVYLYVFDVVQRAILWVVYAQVFALFLNDFLNKIIDTDFWN